MKNKTVGKDHVKALIRIAAADGEVKPETALIDEIARRYELSKREVKRIRKSPHTVKEAIPEEILERTQQLYDLALMVLKDGKKSDEEIDNAMARAQLLGFERTEVNELLHQFGHSIEDGESISLDN